MGHPPFMSWFIAEKDDGGTLRIDVADKVSDAQKARPGSRQRGPIIIGP